LQALNTSNAAVENIHPSYDKVKSPQLTFSHKLSRNRML
jgi:hypothetical protein